METSVHMSPYAIHTYVSTQMSRSSLPTCRLVVYLQENRLYYALISPKEELVLCKECVNTQGIARNLFFRMVFEREKILTQPFVEVRILTSSPTFTLIPNIFNSDIQQLRMARLMLEDTVLEEELFNVRIPGGDAWIYFVVPQTLQKLIHEYFQHPTLNHIAGKAMTIAQNLDEDGDSLLFLHLLDKSMIIIAVHQGRLRLCNSYTYRSSEDILYFIQTVRKVAEMEDSSTPIYITGEIEKEEATAHLLWEFLPQMKFPIYLQYELPEKLAESSWWKYAYLAE